MATLLDLIAWQALREDYIYPAVPIEQILMTSPASGLSMIQALTGLVCDCDLTLAEMSPADTLRNVTMRLVLLSGSHYAEVSTDSRDLFRPIYLLISDVLSRVSEGEKDCLRALELSLSDFESLVAKYGQISREKAIGLFGELWLLQVLLSQGIADVTCWTGANRESHDFRLGSFELRSRQPLLTSESISYTV